MVPGCFVKFIWPRSHLYLSFSLLLNFRMHLLFTWLMMDWVAIFPRYYCITRACVVLCAFPAKTLRRTHGALRIHHFIWATQKFICQQKRPTFFVNDLSSTMNYSCLFDKKEELYHRNATNLMQQNIKGSYNYWNLNHIYSFKWTFG